MHKASTIKKINDEMVPATIVEREPLLEAASINKPREILLLRNR